MPQGLLLDTNVVSETTQTRPNASVMLGLATRNVRDFEVPGLVVHSPWAQDP
jgi:hypothetical protein